MSRNRFWRAALFNSTALVGLSALAGTLLFVGGFTLPAQAQNWTGAESDDWFDGDNWNNGQPPPSAFDGVLNTVTPNATVIDGGDASVRSITIGGGPDLIADLSIVNGGTLAAGVVSVRTGGGGGVAGGDGTITVSGGGSRLATSNIGGFGGQTGTGRLFVLDGGVVEFGIAVPNAIIFSFNPDSVASATVSGTGSTLSTPGGLTVAQQGNATLTIDNGGAVSSAIGVVGNLAGSLGTVTVSGANSTWDNNGDLFVGNQGTGTLAIADGGTVSNATGSVGDSAGSQGTATVAGPGSSWTNSADLVVGGTGIGTLTIAEGGTVSDELASRHESDESVRHLRT